MFGATEVQVLGGITITTAAVKGVVQLVVKGETVRRVELTVDEAQRLAEELERAAGVAEANG